MFRTQNRMKSNIESPKNIGNKQKLHEISEKNTLKYNDYL